MPINAAQRAKIKTHILDPLVNALKNKFKGKTAHKRIESTLLITLDPYKKISGSFEDNVKIDLIKLRTQFSGLASIFSQRSSSQEKPSGFDVKVGILEELIKQLNESFPERKKSVPQLGAILECPDKINSLIMQYKTLPKKITFEHLLVNLHLTEAQTVLSALNQAEALSPPANPGSERDDKTPVSNPEPIRNGVRK